jgi:DNA polymerase V
MKTRAHYLGSLEEYQNVLLTLVLPPVQCGAPGPPETYREKRIQLSDLVDHPYASYLWIASGDSMTGAGIHSGDFLLVDKSLLPKPDDIVIAALNGEPIVKRLSFQDKKVLLLPENPQFKPIPIDPEEGVKMLGVITYTIHPLRGSNGVRRRLSGLQ